MDVDVSVSIVDLKHYICMRSFDVFSEGAYRKYMIKRKDNNDPWALAVYASNVKTNTEIRRISYIMHKLKAYTDNNLYDVCNNACNSVTVPCIHAQSGWAVCNISGISSNECLYVAKGAKCDTSMSVHKKYAPFLQCLWFIIKFQWVITNEARIWLKKNKEAFELDQATPVSLKDVCAAFENQECFFEDYYMFFVHACRHVTLSISRYIAECDTRAHQETKKWQSFTYESTVHCS